MRRHRTDPFSLVFGATFALIGLAFLFAHIDLNRLHLWWVWPAPLIVLGVLIITLAARRESEHRWQPQPATDSPRAEATPIPEAASVDPEPDEHDPEDGGRDD
jgi:hypothetical protein